MMRAEVLHGTNEMGATPALPMGLGTLAKIAFTGGDLAAVGQRLTDRVLSEPTDAAALFDLAIILQLSGDRATGLALQARALRLQRLYRQPGAGLKLLALAAPGDFMANTPLDFLLDGADVQLDICYVDVGAALPPPAALPEHDLLFFAAGEISGNHAWLKACAAALRAWPRPVLNRPDRTAELSRDGAWQLLAAAPGIVMPISARVDRRRLAGVGTGAEPIGAIIADGDFPIIVRPLDSHAGHGLTRLRGAGEMAGYLAAQPEAEHYVSRFVDYAGADGLFRKYRIALIDGRPFVCHVAISENWMVHYLNAGMEQNAQKRAAEAHFMAEFATGFGRRHGDACAALARRVGLDYFCIDCGETPDGQLLVFEMDAAAIVHAMDPPDLYPYKLPQMQKVFDAFRAMLRARCDRAAPGN